MGLLLIWDVILDREYLTCVVGGNRAMYDRCCGGKFLPAAILVARFWGAENQGDQDAGRE